MVDIKGLSWIFFIWFFYYLSFFLKLRIFNGKDNFNDILGVFFVKLRLIVLFIIVLGEMCIFKEIVKVELVWFVGE